MNTLWENMNDRQRRYLQHIYAIDQQQEAVQKLDAVIGITILLPASEWRWVSYGPQEGAALYNRLRNEQLVDGGTGSTFEYLERQGLIMRKWGGLDVAEDCLFVQMTRLGRALIRANTDVPRKPKKHHLSKANWQMLVYAYKAAEPVTGFRHWARVLYRLSQKSPPLVSSTSYGYYLITQDGRKHYETFWEEYQDIYPSVKAPRPRKRKRSE